MNAEDRRDVVVIGGGFYGCCLALFARSVCAGVTLVESCDTLLARASYANQARIHTGFHYPRSFATALRSLRLHRRFMEDFAPAVATDFRMLYAVAAHDSKVSARRFHEMYREMNAPIRPADRADVALFDASMIEAVFACDEFAFDADRLRTLLAARLQAAGVELRLGETVASVDPHREGGLAVRLSGGETLRAPLAFNATYGRLGALSVAGATPSLPIKNELCEIALVEPPQALRAVGVTVMDGPFFSIMPFPARGLHSLTHVRYTPQASWLHEDAAVTTLRPRTRWLNMARDAARYLPAIEDVTWRDSIFEIKSVLIKNESDDGRPIFVYGHTDAPGLYSLLGGKLDNIYDLFDALRVMEPDMLGDATTALVGGDRTTG